MIYSIFTLPAASSTQLLAYAGELFSDAWVLIAIAVGIPLAFYIIKSAIGLVRGRVK